MPDTFADGCAIDYEAINELAAVHRAAEQLLRHIAEFGTDKRYIGDSYAALERAVKKARRYRISQDAGRSLGWYVVDRWAPLSEKYLNRWRVAGMLFSWVVQKQRRRRGGPISGHAKSLYGCRAAHPLTFGLGKENEEWNNCQTK